jgi:hypothetical protein
MIFDTIDAIKKEGFVGFRSMADLFTDSSVLPKIKGIYLVLYLEKKGPEFLTVGTGGHFKGKNPNVPLSELKQNWVDETIAVYIGKAGKDGSAATLQSRLRQYFGFGQGGNVGHWGGRLIWQLRNSRNLVVCWKALPNADPRTVEANLIQEFVKKYGKRPFANLTN